MNEMTTRTIKKSLCFEKSGETLSVEICLENVSPGISTRPFILLAASIKFVVRFLLLTA